MFEDIKEQVKEVIRYSQGIDEPLLDNLFDDWYDGKSDFIDAMGDLRIKIPDVKIELDAQEKKRRLLAFINHIDEDYNAYNLAGFLDSNMDSFYDNRVEKLPAFMYQYNWETDELGDLKEQYKSIKVGMKLLRSFKYFNHDLSDEMIDQIQTEASMLIQENSLEGDLWLSVHPLDYLSSSENTYNWRSCHALDGDYRCGNLSYMSDRSTVICYLSTGDDKKLPRFPDSVPWNSKKWRMLLHFSDNWDMIFAGRQYPFFSNRLLEKVRDELIGERFFTDALKRRGVDWSKWSDFRLNEVEDSCTNETLPLKGDYIPVTGELIPIKDIVKDAPNSKHYNDVLHSSCYKPYYIKRRVKCSDEYPWDDGLYEDVAVKYLRVNVGSEIVCLHCGEELVSMYGMMVCSKCDLEHYHYSDPCEYTYCNVCGRAIYVDMADLYGVNDDVICESCRDELTFRCNRCGRYYLQEDSRYNEKQGRIVCRLCDEDLDFDEE